MRSAGFEIFDETVQKTNQLLKDIEERLGWEGRRNQSYAALRIVLHALRDRLTIEEASELASQLPMLVRGIFYEGWNPSSVPRKIDKEEFVREIRKQFRFSHEGERGGIGEIIGAVLYSLRKHISLGEAEDIVSILPKDLAGAVRSVLIG